jgi:hypothetical protein
MTINIKVIATFFPIIALILGFLLIVSGNSDYGWDLIMIGAAFPLLYLILKYGKNTQTK